MSQANLPDNGVQNQLTGLVVRSTLFLPRLGRITPWRMLLQSSRCSSGLGVLSCVLLLPHAQCAYVRLVKR